MHASWSPSVIQRITTKHSTVFCCPLRREQTRGVTRWIPNSRQRECQSMGIGFLVLGSLQSLFFHFHSHKYIKALINHLSTHSAEQTRGVTRWIPNSRQRECQSTGMGFLLVLGSLQSQFPFIICQGFNKPFKHSQRRADERSYEVHSKQPTTRVLVDRNGLLVCFLHSLYVHSHLLRHLSTI